MNQVYSLRCRDLKQVRNGSRLKLPQHTKIDAMLLNAHGSRNSLQNNFDETLQCCLAKDSLVGGNTATAVRERRPVALSVVRSMAETGLNDSAMELEVVGAPVVQEPLGHTVRNLQDYVQSQQRQIRLETDSENSQAVINVLDPMTAEVVRQIPSEDLLAVSCCLVTPYGRLRK